MPDPEPDNRRMVDADSYSASFFPLPEPVADLGDRGREGGSE